MLLINGAIKFDPARRDDVVNACIAMQNATRDEVGCHSYVFSLSLDSDAVYIAEKWESEDALKAHFAMPHMADFRAATAGAFTGTEVLKYQVSSEGPVF